MVPLLTLGIPSNVVMALFLAALMIHGTPPGPMLIQNKPDFFWGVMISMIILAFILGPLLETALRQSLIISHGGLDIFVKRPLARGALLIALVFLLFPLIPAIGKKRKQEIRFPVSDCLDPRTEEEAPLSQPWIFSARRTKVGSMIVPTDTIGRYICL